MALNVKPKYIKFKASYSLIYVSPMMFYVLYINIDTGGVVYKVLIINNEIYKYLIRIIYIM